MNNPVISPFTALTLKLVGIILIISSLLDYIILSIPLRIFDQQWQIGFTSQIVDRGIIPMVGMAFLLIGYWISSNVDRASSGSNLMDLRLPAFLLASVLGLLFLILVPLHLNNLRMASSDILTQIEQGAAQAETQLQNEVEQLNAILNDPQRLQQLDETIKQLNQAIESGQIQGRQLNPQQVEQLKQRKEQLENLKSLQGNPDGVETRINELTTQLGEQKLERENRAKTEALKQGLRIGLSSLMLSVGYIAIGWFGLKSMGGASSSRRRTSKR